MDPILGLVIFISFFAHSTLVAGVTLQRGRLSKTLARGLIVAILFSMMASLTYIDSTNSTVGLIRVLLLIISFIAAGWTALSDVPSIPRNIRLGWLVMGLLWGTSIIVSAAIGSPPTVGEPNWMIESIEQPTLSSIITLGGYIIAIIVLGAALFWTFYQSVLPETANLAIFWTAVGTILSIGLAFYSSSEPTVAPFGIGLYLLGFTSAMVANRFSGWMDIRTLLMHISRLTVLVGITAAIALLALYLAVSAQLNVDNADDLALLMGIALTIGILYLPIQGALGYLFRQLNHNNTYNSQKVIRSYSRVVSRAMPIDTLTSATTDALQRVLRVHDSCLLLLNRKSQNNVEFVVLRFGTNQEELSGELSMRSALFRTFAINHQPLTHYNIMFGPEYADLTESERGFFDRLHMSAYAPIIVDSTLLGILAAGRKLNDAVFSNQDLELLATLAGQTGVALRNSRLLDDLRHLNQNMSDLNQTLQQTNSRLAQMDAVKTDFVTIASHELRTPLAQIRGYTDIIDALNEQGILDQNQTASLVDNLRKATERMEELIGAMLDVSQLDIDAMDLRFTDVAPEALLRMAIEPLTDAIKRRRLTLSARGLRGLPPIPADLKRLVQAFHNIIVNAIKFTPDGGRIDIVASLQQSDASDAQILISISDSGVGIDQHNLELVFQKFYRAYDPSLHSTGTYKFMGAGPGLGLTIARGVIKGHGGKVWAESPGHNMETNPGSTFHVLLPVSKGEEGRRTLSIQDEPSAQETQATTQEVITN